jgi:hypothetical protein
MCRSERKESSWKRVEGEGPEGKTAMGRGERRGKIPWERVGKGEKGTDGKNATGERCEKGK